MAEKRTPRPRTYGVKLVRGPFVRLEPHAMACDSERELLEMLPSFDRPLAADLFCGAGGMSLGLTEAGYEVVFAVDHDDEALETHRAHHPGLSVNWDLADEDVIQRASRLIKRSGIELVAGGPPCQPFSKAGRSMIRQLVRDGRREGHDRRRDLWESFLRVIELSKPKAVLMENVPDMALDRGMVILRAMTERLESLGYSVEERVVDTWRYGVPQFRQRLILVALKHGVRFRWPDEAVDRVTVDNAIGDLPEVAGGWRPNNGSAPDPVATGWAEYAKPLTTFQAAARAGVESEDEHRVFDHITRPVREDDALAFAQMDHTTRYSQLDADLKRYRDDIFDDKYKRLNPDDVSRTITAHIAKDGYWYIHPYQDRTLTVREAARLQTFPDRIRFAGPPSAGFRQIGNAVPPLLARHLGAAIRRSLDEPEKGEVTTSAIAEELATWYADHGAAKVPWLSATSRWTVIASEILWGRIAEDQTTRAWRSVRNHAGPEDSLAAMSMLRLLAKQWKRESRCDLLAETARWCVDHPEVLLPDASASDLTEVPNVTQAIADLATRVVPGEAEDPVLASYGVLRVAARFHGEMVDRQNRLSDGRLAIARLIGGEDHSHEAHLALIELANGYCSPQAPECGKCPLNPWCETAKSRPVQSAMALTSQEHSRSQARKSAARR